MSSRFAAAAQRLRWPMLVLICLLGIAASVAVARAARQSRHRLLTLTFRDDVEEDLTVISQAVENALEQVRTLAVFIHSAKRVDRDEFEAFVLPALRRHPTLHSLAWLPRIWDEQREAFERTASVAMDRPYAITEAGPGGGPRPAGQRRVYYPITFIEPLGRVGEAMGFDAGSAPLRRAALERARDTGHLVVTPPLAPAPGDGARRAVVAFMPIYRGDAGGQPGTVGERREALLGFTSASLLLSNVIENPLSYWKRPDLQVYLFDGSMPAGRRLVYARHGEAPPGLTADQVMRRHPLHASRELRVGGRRWLLVSTPTARYMQAARGDEPWVLLVVGLTLTGLVAVVLGGMIRGADRMAQFAATREAANAELRERIAEREEAEEALEQANAELRQVNADMERFVGAVSHDLKSPLVAAEMLISVMKQAVLKGDQAKVSDTSRQIAIACGRMRRIIDDLLEHQKAGWSDLRSSAVDMVEVALHVIEEHRAEAARHGVHVQLEDDLPTLRADRGRITAVLDNLVGNALKYACDGPDPAITIGWAPAGGEVRLFVRDHGPGIPEGDRERMWELFQRISRDEEGTGIGLAIVRRVAEAHGGRAWVECPPGGGSIFWVALPADRLIRAEPKRSAQMV